MTSIVTTDRIRFVNAAGEVLVGDLYRPASTVQSDAAAVVVTGSWTTVKEQMAGLYARRLAAEGFVALAFDFAGYGQSSGSPRDVEDPQRKADDINAAVSFLETAPGVDPRRLGAMAVCASSGYTAHNAAHDPRVRSLGMVAPWLHNPELVKPYYGGDEGVAARLAAAERARDRFDHDGTVDYIPAVSETDPSAAMFGPFAYYLDPARGAIPEWGSRFAVMAWTQWLTYNALTCAAHVAQPVRIVHSRDGAVPDGAEAFADGLATPADLIWTDGGQLDFYDQPCQVDFAVTQMADHFRATL